MKTLLLAIEIAIEVLNIYIKKEIKVQNFFRFRFCFQYLCFPTIIYADIRDVGCKCCHNIHIKWSLWRYQCY